MFEMGRDVLLRAHEKERESARQAARVLADLAEFVALHDVADREFVCLEVAAVFRWSAAHAQAKVDLAVALATRLPATFSVFLEGRIDEYKARRIAEVTSLLTDEQATQAEAEVIGVAEELTVRQLDHRLRQAVAYVDPAGAARRAEAVREARRVRHASLDDGAGVFQVQGDVERTQLAFDRVRVLARRIKTAGDERTLDQIMSDVALDCLAGKEFENAKVHVWLTLPATVPLGVDAAPGYLAGYGHLPAQRALELAGRADATWQRVLTDPLTGQAVDVGRRRYKPAAALVDHLRVTYPTCTGPGCVRPAHQCDLDHAVPFPEGATDRQNLRPLCRPHHRAKTLGGWRVRTTSNGVEWVTKHGFRFTHYPEPVGRPEKGVAPPAA